MKLYAHPDKYLTKKMLIAADYVGLDIEIPKNVGKDEVGRIPVLETDGGCIFSTGAISRYISRLRRDVPLYGQNLLESGMIDSWTEFSTNELEVPLNIWVNHAKGAISVPAEVADRAKADTQKALAVLDNHLLNFTYMVGDTITLADITVCCALADGFKAVLSKEMGGNLTRWFKLCCSQPEFQKVIGKIDVAAAAATPAAKGGKPASPKASPKEAPKKKEEAKPKGSPKAAPKAAPAAGGAVDEAAVKACGDEIRILKEKLKAEGVTGKKLNDHAEVGALVKKLADLKQGIGSASAAPAPAAKKEAKAGKKEEKKDEKPPEDPAKKLKKVWKEGGKRGVEIEGAADMGGLQFFCTSVDEPEGDLDLVLKSVEAMNEKSDPTEEERKGGSGAIGKMVFSCGTDKLAIVAYVQEAKQGELVCSEWLQKVLDMWPNSKVTKSGKDYCVGFIPADGDKNIFPLKIREGLILEANNFLRKKGLFPEDDGDSDDDFVFGDDDFPSM